MSDKINKFSFIDLFSGSGGMSLGFILSNSFYPIFGIDNNSIVADTYENNIKTKVLIKSVNEIEIKELITNMNNNSVSNIDVIIGGPPCRPFTRANTGSTRWEVVKKDIKNNGIEEEHPDWFNFWNIVNEIKPKAVVAENVTNFSTYKDVFEKFIERLKSSGYTTHYDTLNAEFFGVPQRRKRIFIVGIRNFKDDPKKLLPSNKTNSKKITVKMALSDLPGLSNTIPGTPISKYKKRRPTNYQKLMRGNASILYDHIIHQVNPVMAKRFHYIPQGYNLKKTWKENLIPENVIKAEYYIGNVKKQFSDDTLINMHSNIYRRLPWDDVSYTITHVRRTVIIHPLQHRLLSVREAARLQSFPDWYRFSGSLSQQYQQIADAVPPLLAKKIAENLFKLIQ